MPAKKLKKKYRHVLVYVREALDLRQSDLATLIGMSVNTFQSVELGRLPLSEKFAWRLQAQIGIRARWFLDNELGNPPPDPSELKRSFDAMQANPWEADHLWEDGKHKGRKYKGHLLPDSGYMAHLLPRMFLLRHYVLAREVANELGGYAACRHSGFNDVLVRFQTDILACLPDGYLRRKVHQKAATIVKEGAAKVCGLVIADATEMRRAVRENKLRTETAHKRFMETYPDAKPVRQGSHVSYVVKRPIPEGAYPGNTLERATKSSKRAGSKRDK